MPATVPDAYPPRPLVTSHSRRKPASRSPQISRPKWTRGCAITVGRGSLSTMLGSPCPTLSYPYGGPGGLDIVIVCGERLNVELYYYPYLPRGVTCKSDS